MALVDFQNITPQNTDEQDYIRNHYEMVFLQRREIDSARRRHLQTQADATAVSTNDLVPVSSRTRSVNANETQAHSKPKPRVNPIERKHSLQEMSQRFTGKRSRKA